MSSSFLLQREATVVALHDPYTALMELVLLPTLPIILAVRLLLHVKPYLVVAPAEEQEVVHVPGG